MVREEALQNERVVQIDGRQFHTDQDFAGTGGIGLGRINHMNACFAQLFEETATLFTQEDRPTGCMISLAATHGPPGIAPLKDMMADHRASAEMAMVERLRRGQSDGQTDVNVEAVAAFFNSLFRGMAVQPCDGATRTRLREIAAVAMNAFPA